MSTSGMTGHTAILKIFEIRKASSKTLKYQLLAKTIKPFTIYKLQMLIGKHVRCVIALLKQLLFSLDKPSHKKYKRNNPFKIPTIWLRKHAI